MPTVVLAHSPLTGPAAWGDLPAVLLDRGQPVVVLDVTEDDRPPYATRYVAHAAVALEAAGVGDVVLVGHSGAGYLLPQLGAARRAARRGVAGYVFLDAGVPHGRAATRLALLETEDAELADNLGRSLAAGAAYPDWTDDDLRELVPDERRRGALVSSLRPRRLDFFTEPLPFPADWPDAPCAVVTLSESYASTAQVARTRGWTVVEARPAGGHFAACVDAVAVADALTAAVDGWIRLP
jgi:hypothetical protein